MSRRSSPQIYLADIAVAVLALALLLGLFRSVESPGGQAVVLFTLFTSLMLWAQFRGASRGPTCEECGRRFVPVEARPLPTECPRCGAEQVRRGRSLRRVGWAFLGLIGLTLGSMVAFIALVVAFKGGPHDRAGMIGATIAVFAMVVSLLAMLFVALFRARLLRPIDRSCEACGANLDGEGPRRCPNCQLRHQGIKATDRARGRGRAWIVATAVLAVVAIAAMSAAPRGAWPAWLEFAIVDLGLLVLFLVGMFGFLYARAYSRIFRLRTDRGAIALARKAAGEEGEIVRDAEALIWYSGPDDPTPMIREQAAAARRAFEAMAGIPGSKEAIRWLVFRDRRAFQRFHQMLTFGMDLTSYDGVHLPYARLVTLCTATASVRIQDPERIARSMAAHALFEAAWRRRPPSWLQNGLPGCVSLAEEPDASLRLNRKMLAAIASGSALGTELFAARPRDVVRMVQGTSEASRYQRVQQFGHQSASIVEYLVRDHPSRAAMGAFLTDTLARSRPEAAFLRHFGRGHSALLDDWKAWVTGRGIGPFLPPSPRHREAILGRVLPILRDPGAKAEDRLLALRSWATEGHPTGADAIINLLDESEAIPKDEVIWALRMASGMAWGDEPDRWRAWYDALPDDCREAPELIGGALGA